MKKLLVLILSFIMLVVGSSCGQSEYQYNVLDDGTVEITDYTGSETDLTIPSTIGGKKVTSIGDGAFEYCDFTSITIPDSVTSIGYYAFGFCKSLKSITIPDSVTSIEHYSFVYCYSLTSINVDSDNNYYSSQDGVLFNKNKTELIQYPIGKKSKSYIIPDSVTNIGYAAFDSCDNLNSVTIPDGVTSIGDGAFSGCYSLESITIPNSVISIGEGWTFSGCNFTSITIPDGVTSIGDGAFSACESLTSIIIPNSVTSIEGEAFSVCDKLKDVYYNGSEDEWKEIDISDFGNECLDNATIHYNYNPDQS